MTKHIPTDIESMSRKELAELCKIQFDENQKLAMDLVTSHGENQSLLEQIEQLQREYAGVVLLLNQYAECLERATFRKVELDPNKDFSKAAKKIKIEQQIKVLESFENVPLSVANHHCNKEIEGFMWCHSLITKKLEQLRKQQGQES